MAHDGSVIIDIDGDSAELEKDLTSVQSRVSKLASEYKKTGMDQSSALKKAWADVKESGVDSLDAVGDRAESVGNDIEDAIDDVRKKSKTTGAGVEDDLDGIGDKASSIGSKLKSFAGTLVKGLAAGVAGLTAAFLATGEASQEFIEDMGKLETAFTTSGHSAETAQECYRGMVGILGETDQSVEAANHLAKLTQSTKELADWNTIAAGVYATFGDSLPLEGLTEAANETARVGQVVGPLADALNWAGVSEDEFNKKLESCTDQQERATLITETLMGLYQEAGETYQEVNADLIAARQAQSDLNEAMSEVGALAMPINTAFKQLGADLLSSLVPSLTAVRDGFMAVFNGDAGSAEQLGAAISGLLSNIVGQAASMLPTIASVGGNIVTTLATGLIDGLPQLAAQGAEMLSSLADSIRTNLPQLLPVALEMLSGFTGSLRESVGTLFSAGLDIIMALGQGIIESLPSLITYIPQIVTNIAGIINDNAPKLVTTALSLIGQLAIGLIQAIPALVANIPAIIQAIVSVFTAFSWGSLGKNLITGIKNGINAAKAALPQAMNQARTAIVNAIKNLPSTLMSLGKSAISMLGSGIRGATGLVKSAMSSVASGILNVIKSLPGKVTSIGGDIVRGIWSGISNKVGWIISQIGGFKDRVVNAIKSKFGIASPSKVMKKEVGRWIPPGITEGVEEAIPEMEREINRKFGGVLSNMRATVRAESGRIGSEFVSNQTGSAPANVDRSVTVNQTINSPKAPSRRENYRNLKRAAREAAAYA